MFRAANGYLLNLNSDLPMFFFLLADALLEMRYRGLLQRRFAMLLIQNVHAYYWTGLC